MSDIQYPAVVYDGTCGFCKRWIFKWRSLTSDSVHYYPYQDLRHVLTPDRIQDCSRAVHLFYSPYEHVRGARAVFKLFTYMGMGWLSWLYDRLTWLWSPMERVYDWVAAKRPAFSSLSRFLYGPSFVPSSYKRVREVFFLGLGAIYVMAFLSLFVQVLGLFGSHGISSIALLMKVLSLQDTINLFVFPAWFWLSDSDLFLQGLCVFGAICGAGISFGIYRRTSLFFAWFTYLSFVLAGQGFLSYQWDVLLLEISVLAFFLAIPSTVISGTAHLLCRWLLFRLMFASGLVKVLSNDNTWSSLKALEFHYWTQPLPHMGSWLAAQLPVWFHRLSTLSVFVIELGVSLLILLPRRWRRFAFWPLILLQLLIFLTGNYGFFNLLVMVMTLLILEDSQLRWLHFVPLPKKWRLPSLSRVWSIARVRRYLSSLSAVCLLLIFLMTVSIESQRFLKVNPVPDVVQSVLDSLQSFQLAHGYGLFAVMTTYRNEIEVQGSVDSHFWETYHFRYKPGPLLGRPRWVQPHQPRLDWQMWFAGLSDISSQRWMVSLAQQLLNGSRDVENLFLTNPFPYQPPVYIRFIQQRSQFSTFKEAEILGRYWRRDSGSYYSQIFRNKIEQ